MSLISESTVVDDKRGNKQKTLQKSADRVTKYVLLVAAAFSIFALLAIVAFLLYNGVPAIAEIGFFKFIFGTVWDPNNGQYGLMPLILGSIYVTVLSTIIGVAIGIFTAIFLHRFCHKKAVATIRQLINLLAGIPSVVFGLFGLLVIVPFVREYVSTNYVGFGILAASIILSIMIMPTIVSISLNALNSVPKELYEGALALGATVEQAEFKVMVPAAKTGILAAAVLSIGRALGETMAVMMVIGGLPQIPTGLTQSIATLTAIIAMGAKEAGGLKLGALIATAIVLLVFAFLINFAFMRIRTKMDAVANGKRRTKRDKRTWKQAYAEPITLSVGSVGGGAIVASRTVAELSTSPKSSRVEKTTYTVLKGVSYVAASIGIIALVGIIVFVFARGVSSLNWHFLFGDYDRFGDRPSIKPALIGTLYIIAISMIIAVPIGIATAIFMSEYAAKSRITRYIRIAIETLAAIPSIVYGLFGYLFFVRILDWGYTLMGGGITIAIMVLPSIIRTTEESLLSVPKMYREGSLALGASKSRTIFKVVLPQAYSGVVTAIILAVGRVISESAVLILTIGMIVDNASGGLFGGGTSLALDIFYFGQNGFSGEAAAAAIVLIIFVVLINMLATFVGKILSKQHKK